MSYQRRQRGYEKQDIRPAQIEKSDCCHQPVSNANLVASGDAGYDCKVHLCPACHQRCKTYLIEK